MTRSAPTPAPAAHRALDHDFAIRDQSADGVLARIVSPFALGTEGAAGQAAATYTLEQRGPDGWVVGRDDVDLHVGVLADVLARLVTTINVAAIASVAHVPVMHAGAVAVGERALVVPAGAGSGKSTLTAALAAAGCAYLTDEAVPLLPDGTARPYAKPLVVRQGSFEVLADLAAGDLARIPGDAWFLDPGSFPAGAEIRDLPIGFVVVPSYVPGAGVQIEPLRRSEVVVAMASNLFNLRELGMAALSRVEQISRDVIGIRVVHSDARSAAAGILERVAR